MATIRKTTYRCDSCGEAIPAKRDIVQFRVERGSRGYYYSDGSQGIRSDLCDSCGVKFLAALTPFYIDAEAIRSGKHCAATRPSRRTKPMAADPVVSPAGTPEPDFTTPRPWKANHGSVTVITSEDGLTEVCEIDCSYESNEAAQSAHADADLIVQAVNERTELLAVGERDKAEIEALTAAVEGLLDVGTRSRSGDPSLDPEEWYAIRDYATNALKDGIGVVDDIRDARERNRRQIARLTEALERIAGVPSGAWVHQGRDAVDTLKSWARAVLADEEDAPQVPQFGGGVLPPPIGPNTLAAGEEDADNG